MRLSLEEAERVLEIAYPKQGVCIQAPSGPNGAFKVIKPNGEVLGAAFDLKAACRQAVQPALKAEAQRRLDEQQAQIADIKAFQKFLREKFNDEFEASLKAREPERAEPSQEQLVQIVPR